MASEVPYTASGNLMLVNGNSTKQYYFRLENEMQLRYYPDRDSAKAGRPPMGEINLLEVGEFKPYNKPIRVNSNIYYVIHLTGNGKNKGWTFGVHGAGRLVLWIKALHRACCLPAVKYVVNTKLHIWAVDELPQGAEVDNLDKVSLVVPDARLYLPGGLEAIAEVTFGPGSLGLRLCTTRAGTAVHHVDAGGPAEARGVQVGDLVLTVGGTATAGMPWRTVYEVIVNEPRPVLVGFGKNKTTGGKPVELSLPSGDLSPEKRIGGAGTAASKGGDRSDHGRGERSDHGRGDRSDHGRGGGDRHRRGGEHRDRDRHRGGGGRRHKESGAGHGGGGKDNGDASSVTGKSAKGAGGGLRRSLPKAIRNPFGMGKKAPSSESSSSNGHHPPRRAPENSRTRLQDEKLVATRKKEIGSVLNANLKEVAEDKRSPVSFMMNKAARFGAKSRNQAPSRPARTGAASTTNGSVRPSMLPSKAASPSPRGATSTTDNPHIQSAIPVRRQGSAAPNMAPLAEGRQSLIPSVQPVREMRSINLNIYQNKSKSAIKSQQPRWKVTQSGAYQGVGNVRKYGDLDFKVGKGFKIGKKPWLKRQVILRDNGLFFDSPRPASVIIPRNSITHQMGRPSLASGLALERILFVDFVLPGGKAAEPIPDLLCSYIGKDNGFTVHTATHIYAFSSANASLDQSWIEAIVEAYNDFLLQQQKLIFAEALALRSLIVDTAKYVAQRSAELKPHLSKFKEVGEKPIAVDREVIRKFVYFLNKQFSADVKSVVKKKRLLTTFAAWQTYTTIAKNMAKKL